jgi:D-alanyl-D-alanine carboxypeptidase
MRSPATARTTARKTRTYVVTSLVLAAALVGALAVGGATTEEDGTLPHGVTAFDEEHAGVANLDPGLLQALRRATTDAAAEGIALHVNSGWRSPTHQERLLQDAVAEHGSEAEAARWVATPDTSAHVTGDAVDVGPTDATAWLSRHGRAYGLCQTYANEPWHFELHPEAIGDRCPEPYPDPTHDPRLQPR